MFVHVSECVDGTKPKLERNLKSKFFSWDMPPPLPPPPPASNRSNRENWILLLNLNLIRTSIGQMNFANNPSYPNLYNMKGGGEEEDKNSSFLLFFRVGAKTCLFWWRRRRWW